MIPGELPIIKVVGLSGSGKSTLVGGLRQLGYDARPVSQEHSDIPDLWRRFDHPFVLIYLTVDLATQRERRPGMAWSYNNLMRERNRLTHALDAADLRVDTTHLSPDQVREVVVSYLEQISVVHADGPLTSIQATGTAPKSKDR